MNALKVRNMSVAYDQNVVVDNVSFDVSEGALTAIVGPNGAGKTTLLKAILGLLPCTGEAIFFGVQAPSKKTRLERIAYVPQRADIDWDFPLNVRDVVKQGRYRSLGLFKRAKKEDRDAVEKAIRSVAMEPFVDRQIGELSGGQQQRVFLARALAQDADLLFMDEPFQGVDAATEDAIVKVLFDLRDSGKSVIAVHHDLSTLSTYFDEIILLNKTLIAAGPISEVFTTKNLQAAYEGRLTTLEDGASLII